MSSIDLTEHGTLDWVLILAPYRKDAAYTVSLLKEYNIRGQAATASDLADLLHQSPGALAVTHEALSPEVIAIIATFVSDQPN